MIRFTIRTLSIAGWPVAVSLAESGLLLSAPPVAAASQHQIQIADRAFQPGSLTVQVGDTVTWSNVDGSPHTVTAENGAFDSGNLDEGGAFSFTFTQPGTFTYRCDYHPEMQATIEVAAAPAAPAQPAPTTPQPAPAGGGATSPQTASGAATGGTAGSDQPDTALPAPWSIPGISLVLAGFGLLSFAIAFLPRRRPGRIAVQRIGGGWRR